MASYPGGSRAGPGTASSSISAAATSSPAHPATPSTPSSAPLASQQHAVGASPSSAASAPPYSAPAYGAGAGAAWPYRGSAARGPGWRTGYVSEAPPAGTGANTVGLAAPRPGLRTFGQTNWVRGPDGRPMFVPGAQAAVREAEEAARLAAEAASKEQDEGTEEEVETVGLTPQEIVEEFKRAGHFDSLRKELLSSFTASPLLPSMQSFVEKHLLSLLDSSVERRTRLAGLDKRLQNMEMCKEIEDNTDLMRRVVASVRGTGEGLEVEGGSGGEGNGEGPKGQEAAHEGGELGAKEGQTTASTTEPTSSSSSSSTALLSSDSRIGVSLQKKVRELVKAERERREEENEGEDNSEAEGKNTPGDSARNGSMTPATPLQPSTAGGSARGGATPLTAAFPSATPRTATFAAETTTVAAPVGGDDEEQDMDMD